MARAMDGDDSGEANDEKSVISLMFATRSGSGTSSGCAIHTVEVAAVVVTKVKQS